MRLRLRAGHCQAAAALVVLLLTAGGVRAHDPISADAAIGLVEEVTALRTRADAEAACDLGVKLEFIIQVLNRDLSAHGGDHGLSAEVLVKELKARGFDLSLWPEARRYRAYLAPLEACVANAPEGMQRMDALYRLVRGRFYDSFVYNPLQPVGLDWADLRAWIADAESFLALHPGPAEREEAEFILAVDYVRAARLAPERALAAAFGERARAALDAFVRTYPDSMRAPAAQILAAAIPAEH